MKQLTVRQQKIIEILDSESPLSSHEIRAHLNQFYGDISRVTIARDMENLLTQSLVKKTGKGRSVQYQPYNTNPLLKYIDPARYFKNEVDIRQGFTRFNMDIFELFMEVSLFSESELDMLHDMTQRYQSNRLKISKTALQRELERLTIELSWKSSQIEGNTYSLLDTEALIKEHRESPGHSKEEAIMILNHKRALDFIFLHPKEYTTLSTQKITDIHRLLITGLDVEHGIRTRLVRIIGTNFQPLDNQHQITESLEKTVQLIQQIQHPFQKALATILLISYIQPFMDGNKRTARILANAVLYANDACPLSYRSVDPVEYKKAILLFYEQNSARYFKELFIEQYVFSVQNYFF